MRSKILFLCIISFGFSSFINSQSIEITDEFKELFEEVAKEEVIKYINNKIEDYDILLAASTTDLISRVAAQDSLNEIYIEVINSVIDYLTYIELKNLIKHSFDTNQYIYSKCNNGLIDKKCKAIDKDEYIKILNLGSLLVFQRIADFRYYLIGNNVGYLLNENTDYLTSIKITEKNTKESEYFVYDITNIYNPHFKIAEDIFLKGIFIKYVLVKALNNDTSFIESITKQYNQLFNKNVSKDIILDTVLNLLKENLDLISKLNKIEYDYSFEDLLSVMISHVYNILLSEKEIYNYKNNDQLIIDLINTFENIQDSYKLGVKYKIGLWSGIYLDGPVWQPDSLEYPVVSFRINDRLQYSFYGNKNSEAYVYVGGFADIIIKQISNNNYNSFVYTGLGYSYYNFNFTISAGYPVKASESKISPIISLMYDVPVSKAFKVFKK